MCHVLSSRVCVITYEGSENNINHQASEVSQKITSQFTIEFKGLLVGFHSAEYEYMYVYVYD